MAKDDEAQSKHLLLQLRDQLTKQTSNDAQQLAKLLNKVDETSLASIRSTFSSFSSKYIEYLQQEKLPEGTPEATQVIFAFCPMAPGRWVQRDKIIQNPYFGSEMLTCGVFEP